MKWQLHDPRAVDWNELAGYGDATVFQTPHWIAFLADTQGGTPVVASLETPGGGRVYFTGLVTSKFGVRILGSPFPGWTTAYMGFNARTAGARHAAVDALPQLAFGELGCMHVEFMDRGLSFEQIRGTRFAARAHYTFHTDLSRSEDELFGAMSSACRRCIRKAEKTGVTVVECDAGSADADVFAAEYYAQLEEVFAKDGLVPPYGVDRVRALIRHLRGTGDLLLVRALDPGGRCIGTSIYAGRNDLAYFWGNASWRDGQIHRPNEALHWYAMRYWKARGVRIFDWGGGGEYKVKYGVQRVEIPWIRRSRFPVLEVLRGQAQRAFVLRQRAAAAIRARRGTAAAAAK